MRTTAVTVAGIIPVLLLLLVIEGRITEFIASWFEDSVQEGTSARGMGAALIGADSMNSVASWIVGLGVLVELLAVASIPWLSDGRPGGVFDWCCLGLFVGYTAALLALSVYALMNTMWNMHNEAIA